MVPTIGHAHHPHVGAILLPFLFCNGNSTALMLFSSSTIEIRSVKFLTIPIPTCTHAPQLHVRTTFPSSLPNGRCAVLMHFSSSKISIKFLTIPVPICTSAACRNRIPLFFFFPAALMQFGPSSPKNSCVLVIHPLSNPWWHLDPRRDKKLSQWLCCDYTTMPLLYCFWSEGMAGLYEQFSNMSGRGLLQLPAFMCRPEVCKQDTLSHARRKERQGTMANLKDLKQERVACGKQYDCIILSNCFSNSDSSIVIHCF